MSCLSAVIPQTTDPFVTGAGGRHARLARPTPRPHARGVTARGQPWGRLSVTAATRTYAGPLRFGEGSGRFSHWDGITSLAFGEPCEWAILPELLRVSAGILLLLTKAAQNAAHSLPSAPRALHVARETVPAWRP
jgi:hypothetical protein